MIPVSQGFMYMAILGLVIPDIFKFKVKNEITQVLNICSSGPYEKLCYP